MNENLSTRLFFGIMMAAAMTLAAVVLAGCGNKDAKDKPSPVPDTAATVAPDTAATAAPEADNAAPAASGGENAGVAWDAEKKIDFGNDFGGDIISAIAWGNNRFVVGGHNFTSHDEPDKVIGIMAYSSDGIAWTAVKNNTFDSSSIYAIAYGNNKFVAGGRDGKMAYSPDGVNWTAVANSAFGDNSISSIVWNGNKFVAVGGIWGWMGDSTRGSSKIAYSPDGIIWTAVTGNPFDTSYISGLAWGKDKFVAHGRGGKMAYSPDGINWTAVTNSTFGNSSVSAIAWGKDKFVATVSIWEEGVGGYGKIMYSSDGITWGVMAPSSFDDWNQTIDEITWGNNTFVAVGGDLDMVIMAYSQDGINWTLEEKPPFDDTNITALTWINGRFAAGNMRGGIVFSKSSPE